ncbi:FecR family protein [Flavobacterium sp. 102]|uniref:FecR family protein n=1 Tax=Flavobacterium sp. 102 TaxID=2135623 RepID=UPI000EB2E5F0|nr:FecR family protein [Flavobacterium sp. 102]RKS03048.1 FecR family protein [Flavobacterium sp. 102]
MKQNEIELLLTKYFTNQANQEDIEVLTKWLEDVNNHTAFTEFVKANYAIDFSLSSFNTKDAKIRLFQKISKEKNIFHQRIVASYFKYAALLVLFLGLGYIFQKTFVTKQNTTVLVAKDEAITLKLADGSTQIISANGNKNITDKFGKLIGTQNDSMLIYGKQLSSGKLVYNTLTIPYGKRFNIQLEDGTIVYLNSGSSLTYPVQFLKNGNRHVSVIGEAFFEVTKDEGRPFIVNAQKLNVKVLGTKFNVNSYADEASTDVVLVEGKVGLYNSLNAKSKMVKLVPGLKGSIVNGQDNIFTEQVNVNPYTAWVKGKLVFRNISFNNIIKRLERHYNVTFINNNKTLGREVFSASFKDESIAEVLEYFSESYAIEYRIKDNKIIIE